MNKLVKQYLDEIGPDKSQRAYWTDLLRDFYNESIYEAAQEIRAKQNNCGGACADDLEGMTEDYG